MQQGLCETMSSEHLQQFCWQVHTFLTTLDAEVYLNQRDTSSHVMSADLTCVVAGQRASCALHQTRSLSTTLFCRMTNAARQHTT